MTGPLQSNVPAAGRTEPERVVLGGPVERDILPESLSLHMRRRLRMMALRRCGCRFPKSFHVVDVGHVGFNLEASCRDVVRIKFHPAGRSEDVLGKALTDCVSK